MGVAACLCGGVLLCIFGGVGRGGGWGGGGLTTTQISQFNASSFITHPCAGLLVSVLFPGIYLQLCTKENIH